MDDEEFLAAMQFLNLMISEPTLMTPCPSMDDATLEAHRKETHLCLRCGDLADGALIAKTRGGTRFLDLCEECLGPIADVCRVNGRIA